jgi:uridine kinase
VDARRAVVEAIADVVAGLRCPHPTRVGIDGRSAAGKTTFADDLTLVLRGRGREVLRASIDDFHRPGHKLRSQRDAWTPRAYYDEGFDYAAFSELVLQPLGAGGTRRCRTAVFDSLHDTWLPERWVTVGVDCVVVVDGVFLLRPELTAHWDYLVWLDVDFETMIQRARERDVAWVGSKEVVEQRYRRHWIPTHELYERLTGGSAQAQAVIDTRIVQAPRIVRLIGPGQP